MIDEGAGDISRSQTMCRSGRCGVLLWGGVRPRLQVEGVRGRDTVSGDVSGVGKAPTCAG